MPQAKLLYDELQRDDAVRAAVDAWIAAAGGPSCEPGTTCKPSKPCYQGIIRSCTDTFACTPTEPVADGTPCGPDLACSRGECVPSVTFSIPLVTPGVYVRNARPEDPEAHVHVTVGGGHMFVSQLSLTDVCVRSETEVNMGCNVGTLTCSDPAGGDSWRVVAGATLERKNRGKPELEGTYRLESPIDVAACP